MADTCRSKNNTISEADSLLAIRCDYLRVSGPETFHFMGFQRPQRWRKPSHVFQERLPLTPWWIYWRRTITEVWGNELSSSIIIFIQSGRSRWFLKRGFLKRALTSLLNYGLQAIKWVSRLNVDHSINKLFSLNTGISQIMGMVTKCFVVTGILGLESGISLFTCITQEDNKLLPKRPLIITELLITRGDWFVNSIYYNLRLIQCTWSSH